MNSSLRSENRRDFGFIGELNRYGDAFHRYWPLITSIGLFFGWLLSFPMQGPLFGCLVQSSGVNPIKLTVTFLLSHFLGLATGGISGYFFKRFTHWFSLGAIACLVISLLLENLSSETWQLYFAIMGFFSGLVVISWGTTFANSVAFYQRGRTFILGAVIANLILYFAITGTRIMDTRLMLITSGLFTAAMPALMLYQNLTRRTEQNEAIGMKFKTKISSLRFWQVLPFILSIYAVGGMMYHVVGSLTSPRQIS